MEKIWKNKIYNNSIDACYNSFQYEISLIISHYFTFSYGKKITQIYPNKFSVCGIIIDCKLTTEVHNLINIEFPQIKIYNGKVYLVVIDQDKEIGKYLFHKLLDENFDYTSFSVRVSQTLDIYNANYLRIAYENFKEIRANYFSDSNSKLHQYEIDFFKEIPVLIKCKVVDIVTKFGYKPGEGRNYLHSYYVQYSDSNSCDSQNIIDYINFLNESNPKDTETEYLEMSPSDFSDLLQTDYFDLDLSRKVSNYISLKEKFYSSNDYFKTIKHIPIIKKEKNNFLKFEYVVITFVLINFDIDRILDFFKSSKLPDLNYWNTVLISQYFLNLKFSSTSLFSEFFQFRNKIIIELHLKNFNTENSYNEIISSFKSIGGEEVQLKKLMYFYINFTAKFSDNFEFDHITSIFYNFFNLKNDS